MDNATFEYLTEVRRALFSGGDIQTVVINELKKLGYKPRTCASGVYVDVGRGLKTLLCADDEGNCRHIASLLAVARTLRKVKKARARLLFRLGVGSDCIERYDRLFDCVREAYAVRTGDADGNRFGYTYGRAFIGSMTLDVTFEGEEADKAAKMLDAALRDAANRAGVSLEVVGTEYTIGYYDTAKGEGVLMETERTALAVDDRLGVTHRIIAKSVYPPVTNSPLCVDRVRSVAGELAGEVKPVRSADQYAQYFAAADGCLIIQADGEDAAELEYELFIGLISEAV